MLYKLAYIFQLIFLKLKYSLFQKILYHVILFIFYTKNESRNDEVMNKYDPE